MQKLGLNIKRRREELGLTQDELAKRLGYKSRSTVNKIENGINDINQTKIKQFAKALNITPSQLMGWEDDYYTEAVNDLIPMQNHRTVPLLGAIACGEPVLAADNLDGSVIVPDGIRADFSLRCKGDSMINSRINDGDIVYIRQQEEVENGEIAAVLIEDEATLKRVYWSDGQLTLVAANDKYTPFIYKGNQLENVRIIGKAVAFVGVLNQPT